MRKRKIEGSTEPNKIARLSSFGFTSSKAASLLDFDHAVSMAETPCSPPKKRGKYLESWKINRPWLRYDSAQNLMFCDILLGLKSLMCSQLVVTCSKKKL